MGTLFVVATPIGNLKDITLRAIEVLGMVDAVACEDTRKTGLLFKHLSETVSGFSHRPKLVSYYEQNELQRIPEIINALKNGLSIALVSDAGTPTISDPGFKLVRQCMQEGIRVESIPGPSAVISALVSSGLPTDSFLFLGYPPKKAGKRAEFFSKIKGVSSIISTTFILYESPYRLVQTLKELMDTLGDKEIVFARELTKVHEEVKKEMISNLIERFSKQQPKGEFVLLCNTKEKNGQE